MTGSQSKVSEPEKKVLFIIKFTVPIKVIILFFSVSAGESVIRRNSENIFASVHDQVSTSKLYNSVKEALEGKSEFLYEKIDRHCGFPSRFVLPKGKIEGLPLVFFVAVTPVTADKFSDLYFDTRDHSALGCGKGLGLFPQDGHAMGFPFDRRIKKTHFYVPNFYEKEVVVFHKRTNEALNASI